MKRAFQFAGIALIVLLGAGPAVAAAGCALESSAVGPSCPMRVTGMDADCPMSHVLAAIECSQDCCNRAAPILQMVNAVPVKPKLVLAVPHMADLTISASVDGNFRPEILQSFAASSPPRYILLRVFRI